MPFPSSPHCRLQGAAGSMSSGDGGWGDGGSADGGPGLHGEEGSTRRSRKRTKQGVYTSDITLDDLARHFHQPASRACQELGMGVSMRQLPVKAAAEDAAVALCAVYDAHCVVASSKPAVDGCASCNCYR